MCFLAVLEAERPESGRQQGWLLVRPLILACRQLLFPCVLTRVCLWVCLCPVSPFFFFFSLYPCTGHRWTFPGQGSNQSCSCRLRHSHSNTGSKPHLRPTLNLQQQQILNPLSEARDLTCLLTDPVPEENHLGGLVTSPTSGQRQASS